jgi:hypothetical protein
MIPNSGCLPERHFVTISQALTAPTNFSFVASSIVCRATSVIPMPLFHQQKAQVSNRADASFAIERLRLFIGKRRERLRRDDGKQWGGRRSDGKRCGAASLARRAACRQPPFWHGGNRYV